MLHLRREYGIMATGNVCLLVKGDYVELISKFQVSNISGLRIVAVIGCCAVSLTINGVC